jgi:hypothetical protein
MLDLQIQFSEFIEIQQWSNTSFMNILDSSGIIQEIFTDTTHLLLSDSEYTNHLITTKRTTAG